MRVNDAVIGMLVIILGISVYIHVQSFPFQGDGHPGPSLFPSVLAILFCVVGVILIYQGVKSKQVMFAIIPGLTAKGIGNIVVTLIAILFYVFTSEKLGFLLTSFIIMLSLMFILKAKPIHALPVAVGMTLFIYCVFNKILLVPLPQGIIYF